MKNKVAVVVGGNGGLGREICKQFLMQGCKVIAIYKGNENRAVEIKSKLSQLGDFKNYKLDITNEEEVKAFFAGLTQVDYLINVAGISIEKPFEELEISEIKQVFDTNLFGKMIACKHAIPLLKNSTSPRIVSIASRFAEKPFFEGMMGYACAEAATVMMGKVLALECAKYGIKANTVSASLTLTDHTREICSAEEIETISKRNPSGRLGNPEDVANLVMFLCREESNYITGENINVNGGILLV